jgi:hypothetical protein
MGHYDQRRNVVWDIAGLAVAQRAGLTDHLYRTRSIPQWPGDGAYFLAWAVLAAILPPRCELLAEIYLQRLGQSDN